MKIETVAIYSPGEMGEVTGRVLKENGLRVVAALEGRSERTRGLAGRAGIEDVGSLANLVREADLVLSILVPSAALEAAREIAEAVRGAGEAAAGLLYVDCNAVSPASTRKVEAAVKEAGMRFVDASIIGPPPRRPGVTRFYASGTDAADFAQLGNHGLDVRVIGEEIGQASGIKMCYAGLTKGLNALAAEVLVAASLMNLTEPLLEEFRTSQEVLLGWIERSLPGIPPKAHRFIGEMEEIAATYEQLGQTPRIELGAADMYRAIARTRLGKESPEERDKSRSLETVVGMLAEDLRTE